MNKQQALKYYYELVKLRLEQDFEDDYGKKESSIKQKKLEFEFDFIPDEEIEDESTDNTISSQD